MRFLVFALLLIVVLPKAAYAQCVNPAGTEGDVIYNSAYNAPQYCDGSDNWIAMVGTEDCTIVGSTCANGSVYAGLSPDGNVPMYTTSADAASTYTWNDGTGNYTDMSLENCADASPGTAASCQTGEANTAFLVGATGEPDYPFAAAEYCDGLSAHGYDDWYLPAQDELNVLYINKSKGALNGTFAAAYYWSSSESRNDAARRQEFGGGIQNDRTKSDSLRVRCVRRDQAGEGPSQITQIVPNGLIGHWRLDEESGTTAYDTSGNDYHGTMMEGLNGGDDSTRGVIGPALMFDPAQDHYIVMPEAPAVADELEATFCAWANPKDTNGPYAIVSEYRGGSATPGWSLQLDGANRTIEFHNGSGSSWQGASDVVIPKKWSYYCATFSGGN